MAETRRSEAQKVMLYNTGLNTWNKRRSRVMLFSTDLKKDSR